MTGILLHEEIRRLVAQVAPLDTVEDEHRRQALTWLDSTSDIFRRIKPRTPSPHLVSYFLLIDHDRGDVLLVDHRRAGLWLPTGGHVEPAERPAAPVRRETREELGIEALFSPVTGENPVFVTVTQTAPRAQPAYRRQLVVRLVLRHEPALSPDRGEFRDARWWARDQIEHASPALFDPHVNRTLRKFDRVRTTCDRA
jgi:8-oxo-dGTP pyrophosphatase MutT (NUDIX family)